MFDFNPRPREEGDGANVPTPPSKNGISIHALVKRATIARVSVYLWACISIHALVKRATT